MKEYPQQRAAEYACEDDQAGEKWAHEQLNRVSVSGMKCSRTVLLLPDLAITGKGNFSQVPSHA